MLYEVITDLHQLVRPVQGKANHPGLLADGLQDGLAYPPDGVGDEVVTLIYISYNFV